MSTQAAGETLTHLVRDFLVRRALELALLQPGASQTEIESAIETLLYREVTTPEATEEECSRFYAQHLDDFRAGELVCARHILFAVTPGGPLQAIRGKAEETLLALQREPERFEAFARERSNCPSGESGGNLGQIARGDVAPEFGAAIFGTRQTGLLPALVRTRYGFHIVVVDQRIDGQVVPFEAVRERIAAELRETVQERALRQYVQVLAAQARVEIPGLGQPASPLVR